jgi:hypothetical protein
MTENWRKRERERERERERGVRDAFDILLLKKFGNSY